MHLIRPFAALRPTPQYAAAVAAPPYDVLTSEEARVRARGKPWSFLHISKAEIDLPGSADPHSDQVYTRAADNFRRMIAQGVLARDAEPGYYAYRLIMNGHVQVGLVVGASVRAYDENRIRKHELTRPDKEDDRVRQIEALGTQTGPALLAYPSAPQVDEMLVEVEGETPDCDITADDGVRHTIWPIRSPDRVADLTAAFDAMPALYIADGHHRSAAASRVAAARRATTSGAKADAGWEYFLAVAFPHHQMQILPYHRVVRDLNGLRPDAFLTSLRASFRVEPSPEPVAPLQPGQFGLYLSGRWYGLQVHPRLDNAGDPIARLDVSVLADRVLAPLLDLGDPRRDRRIDFVGGIRGLAELERRVDSGEMAAAFSLHATHMEDLMAVADAGAIMPPKSTWFEPKLADGLVSYVLD